MKLILCALALAAAKEHTNYQALPEHPKLREKSLVIPLTKEPQIHSKHVREKPAESFLESTVTRKKSDLSPARDCRLAQRPLNRAPAGPQSLDLDRRSLLLLCVHGRPEHTNEGDLLPQLVSKLVITLTALCSG